VPKFSSPLSLQSPCQLNATNISHWGLFISGHERYRCSVDERFGLAIVVDDDPDIALAAKLALAERP
jgi:hypothetical protein